MVFAIGSHPGARWLKVDLQCHTPRDLKWYGSSFPGGTPPLEAARQQWAVDFVQACLAKGLSIIAVTDHHDVAFLPYIIDATKTLPEGLELTIFPGIEITCSDSVQCLAIFEPSTTRDDWNKFLFRLPKVTIAADIDAKTAQVTECGLKIEELYDMVAEDVSLNQKVILIPHFGNEDAHKSLNQDGFAGRARNLPCDGVYIECHYSDLEQTTVDKIQGRIMEWGTRRRAIIATGDNRFSTWARLGLHECWMKLGENSIEGIRQVFLADEARLAYSLPEVPYERILDLEIKATLTGLNPLKVSFNDGYTAIIGGRGSGKSSILEYLRFGLGKAETDLPTDSSARRRRDREAKLIDETLKNGWVKIVLEREGVRETWFRSGGKPEEIIVTLVDGSTETITVLAAQQRFPARAFHQKELSTTMLDPESAAENITGIAAAEVIEKRRRIDQDIINAKRTVTTALQESAAHWQSELELIQAKSSVLDLKRRLAVVSAKLKEEGVQPEDLAILADAPRYGRAQNFINEVERITLEEKSNLDHIVANILPLEQERFSDVLSFTEIAEIKNSLDLARQEAASAINNAIKAFEKLESVRESASAKFYSEAESFQQKYEFAKERQATHSALIADNERLNLQLKEALSMEDRASANELAKRAAIENFQSASEKLNDLVEQRYDLLQKAASEVEQKSEHSLKARVKRDRKPLECISALCGLMDGSRFREPEQHCTEWLAETLRDKGPGLNELRSKLVSLYRAKLLANNPSEPGLETIAAIREFFFQGAIALTEHQVSKIYHNLNDQSVGQFISAIPKDSIQLTYISDKQSINFAEASPGQQASALLKLLLRQEAGTLIVDQPEDDLDNRVLMSIVELIRTSKTKRQLIFATHNPNLVVNGDADKIIAMVASVPEDREGAAAPRFRIDSDGAIETPHIRATITRVMEGGIFAFDLRARKYGLDGINDYSNLIASFAMPSMTSLMPAIPTF